MAPKLLICSWHNALIGMDDEVPMLEYIASEIPGRVFLSRPLKQLQLARFRHEMGEIGRKYPNPAALDTAQEEARLREIYRAFNAHIADGLPVRVFDSLVDGFAAYNHNLVEPVITNALKDANSQLKKIMSSAYRQGIKSMLRAVGYNDADDMMKDCNITASGLEATGEGRQGSVAAAVRRAFDVQPRVRSLELKNYRDSAGRRAALRSFAIQYGVNHRDMAYIGSDPERDALCFADAGVPIVSPLASDANRQRIATTYGARVRTPGNNYVDVLRAFTQ